MNRKKVFLVIGGDLRQTYLSNILARSSRVYTIGCSKEQQVDDVISLNSIDDLPEQVDYLILPIPVTNDGVNINIPLYDDKISIYSTIPLLKHNAVVFGGKFGTESAIYTYKGFEVVDYLEREELSVMNAVPTAEGAIMLAMEELPTTIFGSKILVTGFGRISKVLVRQLEGLSAKVYVAARKYSDLVWAEINNCRAIHMKDIEAYLGDFDMIINTVPFTLFDEKRLTMLNKECLFIDLASKPGGVDFDAARNVGVKVIWALSLPLK